MWFLVAMKVLFLWDNVPLCGMATVCLLLFSELNSLALRVILKATYYTFSINYFSPYVIQRHFLCLPSKKLELCTKDTLKQHNKPPSIRVKHCEPTHIRDAGSISKGAPGPNPPRPPERPAWLCKGSIYIQLFTHSSGGVRLDLWSSGLHDSQTLSQCSES